MIISHKHKFIFIKTAKTGGSSIEKILDDCLDAGDIASGTIYKDSDKETPTRQLNWTPIGYPQRFGGDSHASAQYIYEQFFDGKKPNGYFVFTIERNPYDKAVSHWWWHNYAKRKIKNMRPIEKTFEDHLKTFVDRDTHNHPSCWRKYTNNDEICVDKIYRYEEWNQMFDDIQSRLGLELNLIKTKNVRLKDSKKPYSNYKEVYNSGTKTLVDMMFNKEINHFGYKYE